jgi:hypothetical protein
VENLISKLTTPTPPPKTSKTDNNPYFPLGFAPAIEPDELLDENADNLVYDSDDDDIDPVTKTVVVDRPLVRPKVRTQTRQDGSRRPKDRRVSEQQSEVNSAELLWFNRIYEDTFDISDDGAIYTIVPITLSTGLTLRPGDCIPADAADLYVQYVQDNTQHAKRQRMLAAYMAPVTKAPRIEEVTTKATTSTRRRQKDDDDKSVSTFGDDRSVASAVSVSSNRRGLVSTFATPDPLDKTRPMPSPITSHQGQFPFRREHVNSITSIPELLPTIVPPDFFRLDPSLQTSKSESIQVFDKRRPFSHSDKSPYKFSILTWKSYRVQMGDLIAHWRGGRGAEDVLLWPC